MAVRVLCILHLVRHLKWFTLYSILIWSVSKKKSRKDAKYTIVYSSIRLIGQIVISNKKNFVALCAHRIADF